MNKRVGRLAAAGVAILLVLNATPAQADNVRDHQWFLTSLDIAVAQNVSRGNDVVAAVIDTGVDGKHVDLTGNVLQGADFTTSRGGNGWTDKDGHGTAMASLIAGHGHGKTDGALGIAPQARVLPVRHAETDGMDRGEIARSIRWAVDNGADVIALSLHTGDSPSVRQAVEYALGRDVIVVAAVGLPGGLGKVPAPARIPGVVAVSGVDKAGNIAASVSGPEVVIAAPGKEISHASKDGGYALGTGTSDATAIVSGVVALIRSKYPELDAANVINRLIQTADDKGAPGRDEQYGFGIVNPVRALTADVPSVHSNPLLSQAAETNSSVSATATGSPAQARPPDSSEDSPSSLSWVLLVVGVVVLIIAGVAALLYLLFVRGRSRSRREV